MENQRTLKEVLCLSTGEVSYGYCSRGDYQFPQIV